MNLIRVKSALANEPAGIRRVEPLGPRTLYQENLNRPEAIYPSLTLLDIGLPTSTGLEMLKRLRNVDNAVLVLTAAPPKPPIQDLQLLREEEQNTDEPITHQAYSRAKQLLEYVYAMLGDAFPQAHLAPDGAGGIRMEWFLGDSNIRVVIPPRENQRRYIYAFANGVAELKELSPVSVYRVLRSHIAPR